MKHKWKCRRKAVVLFAFLTFCFLFTQIGLSQTGVAFRSEDNIPKPDVEDDSFCGACVPCQMMLDDCLPGNETGSARQCLMSNTCEYDLERLPGTTVTKFNVTVEFITGTSSSFVYKILPKRKFRRAGQGSKAPSVLVKVSCLPYFSHKFLRGTFIPKSLQPMFDALMGETVFKNWLHLPCPTLFTGDLDKIDVAMWKVAKMCDVDYLLPKTKIGEVKGRMPETGYEFTREGLFQEEVDGLSLSTIVNEIENPDTVQEILMNRIHSSQIVDAAIFDLLTRQRDRNSANLFISESGDIKLIDNNAAFGSKISSIFLPATRLHTKLSLGREFLLTNRPQDVNLYPIPSSRLDYRCHTNGTIGKNYPTGLASCMRRISASSAESLTHELGLTSVSMAKTLIQSATDMLQMGFEWTLYNGGPSRKGGGFYPQEPCCGFNPHSSEGVTTYGCKNKWTPHLNIHQEFRFST